jgi:hypothetical protein
MRSETPKPPERARTRETPKYPERASEIETPKYRERAIWEETPRKLERAKRRQANPYLFHSITRRVRKQADN